MAWTAAQLGSMQVVGKLVASRFRLDAKEMEETEGVKEGVP
jgi:hypothetical protein